MLWKKSILVNNKDLNDFLECSWKKEGTLNDNGEINWDKADEFIADELTKATQEANQGTIQNAVKETCVVAALLGKQLLKSRTVLQQSLESICRFR